MVRIMRTIIRSTDNNICMTFMQSIWVQWWYAPTLNHYNVESNKLSAGTSFFEDVVRQRKLGTSEFGTSGQPDGALCWMKGTEKDKAVVWPCKALLLSLVTVGACEIDMDLAFIQFM